jgi:hypothetical protein
MHVTGKARAGLSTKKMNGRHYTHMMRRCVASMIVVPCASFSCLIWMSVCAYVYATDPSLILRALGARWRKTKALGCSSQASKSLKKGSRQKTAMVLDHTPGFWLVCCFSLLVFFLSHTHSTVYIPHYWQSRVG